MAFSVLGKWKRGWMFTRVPAMALTMAALAACGGRGQSIEALSADETRVLVAREIVTMNPEQPTATAIALRGSKIVALGSLDDLNAQLDGQDFRVDERFADKVLVPGLINQHDHPWLAGLTMSSHVIAIEDWEIPGKRFPKAASQAEYRQRLGELVAAHADPDELFFSWGYHRLWHGELNRDVLDSISRTVPILIWQRSMHEFIANSAALEKLEVNQALIDSFPPLDREQINLAHGHFWERGALAVGPQLFKHVLKPASYMRSLDVIRDYWHAAGSTQVVEPGGMVNRDVLVLQNRALADASAPFHMDYIIDGKTLAFKYLDDEASPDIPGMLAESERLAGWGRGMSRFLPKQVKLFSDGALFSQLMRMSEGYLDGHHGEWMMDPPLFKRAFAAYWDADYQIHVHQNGDAGLDLVLDTLAENMARKPRQDHRTVIVHFSFSRPDQVERLKQLGAIVSVNPYAPIVLANTYSEYGVGAERAHAMARLGDVARAGVSFSLHSDMPVAPGKPLYLMWSAVNRLTLEGNIVGPEQRITAYQALKALTLDAAYSMRLEAEIGSLVPGKLANITVLDANPLTINPEQIKDIDVWGTVHEGRFLPVAAQPFRESGGLWDQVVAYSRIIWFKIIG